MECLLTAHYKRFGSSTQGSFLLFLFEVLLIYSVELVSGTGFISYNAFHCMWSHLPGYIFVVSLWNWRAKGTYINIYVDTHAACWAMSNIVLCLTQESPVFHVIHYSSQFLTLVQYSLLVLLTEPSSFPSSDAFLSFVSWVYVVFDSVTSPLLFIWFNQLCVWVGVCVCVCVCVCLAANPMCLSLCPFIFSWEPNSKF